MLQAKASSLINYIHRFVELSDEEITLLLSKVNYRKYLKGQYIVQQGDICRHSNFIVAGCARMFCLDEKGNEYTIMFAVEEWWASDLGSFISQENSDYNIQCLENTEVIQFDFEGQEELFDRIPTLDRFFRKVLERGLVATQKRIIGNFSLSAKERYLAFKEQYPNIEQRIPQYMLASYLGITKEFLSKIKSQLADQEVKLD